MRVRRYLIFVGWSIDFVALHSQWAVAIIELINELAIGIRNANRADNFVSLDNDAARSITFATRRRHVMDSLRDMDTARV